VTKVSIVGGTGGVGASVAFNLLLSGPYEVVLVDRRPEMITSHTMDLDQVLLLGEGRSVRGGDEEDIIDSDVVVLSASVPLRPNASRLEFLNDNAAIVAGVARRLVEAGSNWSGVLVMVTNPVEPLCMWAQQLSGVEPRRIVGYTLNDTLRLRTGVAQALGVDGRSVEAWVIGEHGDSCVPLFGSVRVAGEPVDLKADQRSRAEGYLKSWYRRHVSLNSGRTSTWTSGLGVARMVEAIREGTGEVVWPASVLLSGEYGIDGVYLSVPVSLGHSGVHRIHEWRLEPEELSALQRAAGNVRRAAQGLGAKRAGT